TRGDAVSKPLEDLEFFLLLLRRARQKIRDRRDPLDERASWIGGVVRDDALLHERDVFRPIREDERAAQAARTLEDLIGLRRPLERAARARAARAELVEVVLPRVLQVRGEL